MYTENLFLYGGDVDTKLLLNNTYVLHECWLKIYIYIAGLRNANNIVV